MAATLPSVPMNGMQLEGIIDPTTTSASTDSQQCVTCGGSDVGNGGGGSVYTRVGGHPLVQLLATLVRCPLVDLDLGGDWVCAVCLARFDDLASLLNKLVEAAQECIKIYNTAVRSRQTAHPKPSDSQNQSRLKTTVVQDDNIVEVHGNEDQVSGDVDQVEENEGKLEKCLLVVEGADLTGNQSGIVGRALAMASARPKQPKRKDQRRFKCRVCDKVFSAYSHRVEHMVVHTGERDFHCDMCGFAATTKSNLTKHRLRHTHQAHCQVCNKLLGNKFSLKEHMKVHSNERPHCCVHCHKPFRRLRDLRLHERSHLPQGDHQCHLCEKTFVVKSRLARHMLTHQTDKQFTCQVCQKKFARKDDLQCHERIHTGVKPYVCKVCGKEFRYASNCLSHTRTHTKSLDTHSCDTCHLTFPTRAKYLIHLKSRNHRKKSSDIKKDEGPEHIFCLDCKMSFSQTDFVLHKTVCCDKKMFESTGGLPEYSMTRTAEHTLTQTAEHILTQATGHTLIQTAEHTVIQGANHTLTHIAGHPLNNTTEEHSLVQTAEHSLGQKLTQAGDAEIILSDYTEIILPMEQLAESDTEVNVEVSVENDPLHIPIISAPAITSTITTLSSATITSVFPSETSAFSSSTTTTTMLDEPSPLTAILPISLDSKHENQGGLVAQISGNGRVAEAAPSPSTATVTILNPSSVFKISDWDLQQYYHKS
ncbi:hypothetical protein Pcinc_020320 [Petrolisthes cinctipes]|uniref:C2H2-type domain-containing protein n=1 Tax=Petrolisthes cinctipes TaxID=88211 RepID=A0AAE1FJD5_PETCI|nr:hypothetical protein Pcinc_020320 [Petrolisthes cinctipes]